MAILVKVCLQSVDNELAMGSLVRACEACRDAALAYGMPFISGKDSLNNEFALSRGDAAMLRSAAARYGVDLPDGATRLSIPGTLLISALSIVPDVSRCVTMESSRTTTAALAGFAFVNTPVIWLVTLRRNRFRPWLPT